MDQEAFKPIQQNLPNKPGVYKYYDSAGALLYVGKAKDLRKRVSSYFTKSYDSNRIRLLVRKIDRIDYTIVGTEQDALLLENTLIKEFQPRYNVALKDDKSYPFICIKNERFPRIFITRRLVKDGSEYLGPYTSVVRTRAILEFIRSLFPIRTCKLNLIKENVDAGKFKVCLEYHLGNCLGPCENLQSEEDYNDSIAQIRHILRGNFAAVKRRLREDIKTAATDMAYEQAAAAQRRLELIEDYQSKSTVVSSKIGHVDVFAIADAEKFAYVSYLKVMNGVVVQTKTVELTKKLDETKEELLRLAITELRGQAQDTASKQQQSERQSRNQIKTAQEKGELAAIEMSRELILPFLIDYPAEGIGITVPQRGEKLKLLQLAKQNALHFKSEKINRQVEREKKSAQTKVLEQIQADFHLKDLPVHMECFDNSNIQGSNPVASVVVFRQGKAFKNDYRQFHIKTVVGPDDYGSMTEVVGRRYKRLLEEGTSLPQLVLIDGGKGQLNAAYTALKELGIESKIALISIAKRLEEIYFPHDPLPLHLSKRSSSLKVMQQMRNEAHRFAINFHRKQRLSTGINTELTDIKGIGEKTISELLTKFRSVKKIREATYREIATIVGKSKARLLFKHFESEQNADSEQDGAAE